jgi:uncharacterized protein YjdB
MKVFRSYILVVAVSFVASLGLMSCLKGGTISSIEVTPANASMATGAMQQFIATARFTDGTTLNWTSAVNWTSSNTEVAIVSNTTGSNGIVTAVADGTAIITAVDATNSLSGNATLAVNTPVSITVTPANQVISLATTTQVQFTAKAIFTPGTELDLTTLVFWSSSNPGVATISNASGTNGLATAVVAGTTSITATDLITNVTGSTTLTVTP